MGSFLIFANLVLLSVAALGEEDSASLLIVLTRSTGLFNSSDMDTPRQLIETPTYAHAYSVDYHYNRNLVFVSTRYFLFRTKLFHTEETPTPFSQVMTMGGCEGFAVDWKFDRIFWADCSEDSLAIKVNDLEGGNSTTLSKRGYIHDDYHTVKRMEVDPYSGLLFWIKDGKIESCETTGENLRTNLISSDLSMSGLALDLTAQRLYCVAAWPYAALFSVDYKGLGDLRTHLTVPEMSNVFGFGVLRGYAYWVDYKGMGGIDVLYKAPLENNSSRVTTQLKTFYRENTVWHMKVVDPDRQKPPSSDPFAIGGSSSLASPEPKTEKGVAGAVLLGAFIVVGVVLVGLVMFLKNIRSCDLLRSKRPRVL